MSSSSSTHHNSSALTSAITAMVTSSTTQSSQPPPPITTTTTTAAIGAPSSTTTTPAPRPISVQNVLLNSSGSGSSQTGSAFRTVATGAVAASLISTAGGNAPLVPLVEALPLEINKPLVTSPNPAASTSASSRISNEMVNASGVCRVGSTGNLAMNSGVAGAVVAAGTAASNNVTTSTASVTGMMGNGNTSAFTSQHSAGGEFFYFDDDLRDFSSAGDSAAQPVPAAAELIAADVDVESIERLLDRLRRADMAHGQRQSARQQQQQQQHDGTCNSTNASLSALLIARQNELLRQQQQQHQQQQQQLQHQQQIIQNNINNKNTALALFGVGGQSKSDSCLAGSRSSPDTYGLFSDSADGAGGDICVAGRELSMSWPLNDSAIVFRQYPLFADDTALMLTSSMLAACPANGDDAGVPGNAGNTGATKSATVAGGLTTAALLQAHRRQQQILFHQQQQQLQLQMQLQSHPGGAVTLSATGSMTLNSELMDVLSRKHNYRLTFAGGGSTTNHGANIGRSGMHDSLASDRSHLSRGSAADVGDSALFYGSSAAAKAALLRRLQDDLNARCVNLTYEKIKNQFFGPPPVTASSSNAENDIPGTAVSVSDVVFQPIERPPPVSTNKNAKHVPLKPTTSSASVSTAGRPLVTGAVSTDVATVPQNGRRSRQHSENCASPGSNSADEPTDTGDIRNSLRIDSSDLEEDSTNGGEGSPTLGNGNAKNAVDGHDGNNGDGGKGDGTEEGSAAGAAKVTTRKKAASESRRNRVRLNKSRSHTIGATVDAAHGSVAAGASPSNNNNHRNASSSRKRTSSETRSSSLPLSSQVNGGCIEAWRSRSDTQLADANNEGRRLQYAWPVPKRRLIVGTKHPKSRKQTNSSNSPSSGDANSCKDNGNKATTAPSASAPPARTTSKQGSADAEDDDELSGTRYHSPSPIKATATGTAVVKPVSSPNATNSNKSSNSNTNNQQHRRSISISPSPSSASSLCGSASSTSLSCCEDHPRHRQRHHSHHHHHSHHRHHSNSNSKNQCSSCQTVVPSSSGAPQVTAASPSTGLATISANIAMGNESPLPSSAASPGACSSSYATVHSHQRSKLPTQMAANFIPPPPPTGLTSTATSSAHHASPQLCQQHSSCLCLAFAHIWHSVLAAQTAAASSVPSSCVCQHQAAGQIQNNAGHALSKLTQNLPTASSATGSPPSICFQCHHHSHSRHHSCREHHHRQQRRHRHSDAGPVATASPAEDLRTIGTQFPLPQSDCATQTPPLVSPQIDSPSMGAARNSSAEKSPDQSRGPVAVIFDPQSHTSSDVTSPPETATTTGSPPVIKSYFFTFRSMPNVNFLRTPSDSVSNKRQWRLEKTADAGQNLDAPRDGVVPNTDEAAGDSAKLANAWKKQLRSNEVGGQSAPLASTGIEMPTVTTGTQAAALLQCTQPPPPPRPPRTHRHRRIGNSNSSNSVAPSSQQNQPPHSRTTASSGDSGASLASYSVDGASLSRSPRYNTAEEESGIGMHNNSNQHSNQQQSPPGMLMEQCGRRLLLLPQNSKKQHFGDGAGSPSSEQPKPASGTVRLQPCIAEEQAASSTAATAAAALLSATVDLQSPSSALLQHGSPDIVATASNATNVTKPKELFSSPARNHGAFLFNDETVACLHATSPFINPVLRREEEQAKERVRSLGNAVDEILHLFEPTTTSAPTATNAFNAKRASLHYVVYSALCPSLVHLLSHGFMAGTNVSLFAAVVEIITTGEVSEQSVTLVCQVAEMRLADSDDKKLLALFVGLLNLRWLPQWLCELYQNQEGVRRFYAENALLAAATSGCRALFWAAVQSLRPLSTLDLQLSLTSILNHHDVSSGAFPVVSAATSIPSPRPASSPVVQTSPTHHAVVAVQQQQQQQRGRKMLSPATALATASIPMIDDSPNSIVMEDLLVIASPKAVPPVTTTTTTTTTNSYTSGSKASAIPRSGDASSKRNTPVPTSTNSSSHAASTTVLTASGIPLAQASSSSSKASTAAGSIPKPLPVSTVVPQPSAPTTPPQSQAATAQRKKPVETNSVEVATVEKAQPINVLPPVAVTEPPKSALLRRTTKATGNTAAIPPVAPPTPTSATPPIAPSTTPLSGNRVRMPSSTPIFQRGNSDKSTGGKPSTAGAGDSTASGGNSSNRRTVASPATVMGNSNSSSSSHQRNRTSNNNNNNNNNSNNVIEAPNSHGNITASTTASSSSSASPSASRRRPLAFGGASKRP